MSMTQRASPLLVLVARCQAAQAMPCRRPQSLFIVNIAHSQCKSRQLSQSPSTRLYATTGGSVRTTHHNSIYNTTGSQSEKAFKTDAASRFPPPAILGEVHNDSPLSKNLPPTLSSPPFIVDTTYNPPASTRPVALEEVPPQQEGQSRFSHLVQIARSYLTFYKRGFQNINASRKLAKQVRTNMAQHQQQFQAILSQNPQAAQRALTEQRPPWTRAEFQLLRRSRHDMSRLPVFGLLFVIFGEFLPLVMFALKSRITPLLPYTVRLPVQVEADRKRMLAWRSSVQQKWDGKDANNDSIDNFALYGAEYFGLGPRFWPLRYQPRKLVLRNTRRYYEYLLYDDVLLGAEGVAKLLDEEVVIAAIERGVWDDEASVEHVRERLQRAVLRSLGPATDDVPMYGRTARRV